MNKYHELPKSHSVLIADNDVLLLYTFFSKEFENLVTGLYDKVFLTPELYDFYVKSLSTDDLKEFRKKFKKIKFKTNKLSVQKIMNENEILSDSEAHAMLCCISQHMDCILDDPQKAYIFKVKNINVIRPSELICSAMLTQRR